MTTLVLVFRKEVTQIAHYAFLDENNIVTEVITGRDEGEVVDGISDWEAYYGQRRNQTCKRTSYNGNIRKNYAGISFRYDEDLDAFIPPQPYPSWVLDEDTARWEAPIPYPTDGLMYSWNEDITDWEPTTFPESD
jgi:hypothetical protein